MIISFWNLLDCYVISSVPVVDAEVDPPQQISPVSATTMNLVFISGLTRIFTGLRLHLPYLHPTPPEQIGHFVSAFE
jgi:hypothetical protein